MHINNWVHASDLMKMIKSANSISTLSSEEGLPDNHVITIRERELTVDFPELIQNNIKTDTVTLDLDAEWDGIQPVIIFGPNADGTIAVEYTGEPVHIPGAVMQYVGGLDCSVMGLDDSGEVRLVTKAAPNTFEVVESGEYIGQISEDDVSLLGQILSAIKDAKTATSDASSAAEAATAAANSANTAATKATDAANSANTAATKATNAANSANTASERAENAYDVLTPIIAEIGVNGNQPRATTNPNHIATASDAYAAKPLEICIKGETRQNLWVNPSGTQNGATVTSNDDGSVTISGEVTTNTSFLSGKIYTLKPGVTYTASVDKTVPISGYGFFVQSFDGTTYTTISDTIGISQNTRTFTVPSNSVACRCGFQDENVSGNSSGTYHVMLNEGSTAQPWCPPGLNSVDELSVVTAGKNLLQRLGPALPTTNNGITFSDNGDSGIRVSGTATNTAYFNFFSVGNNTVQKLPAGGYSISLGSQVPGIAFSCGYFNDTPTIANANKYVSWLATGTVPPTLSGTLTKAVYIRPFLSVSAGKTVDTVVYPQLELGSTATAYEPPNFTTTPIDLDGHALCSLPDGTCDELTIDATGAVTLTQRVGSQTFNGDEDWKSFRTDPTWQEIENWASNIVNDSLAPLRFHADVLPKYQRTTEPAGPGVVLNGRYQIRGRRSDEETLSDFKSFLASAPMTVLYPLATPQTIPLPSVTLPTLPSPNITVYHDSDVPSDITVEYVRDINIVLDNLNAKIAALNIAQSISS